MSYDDGYYRIESPPAPRKRHRVWPWVLTTLLGLGLLGTVVTAVAGRSDGPVGPVVSPAPAKGLPPSAGPLTLSVTPGGYCTTSQLTRQFVTDGVTYTCGGPKPYRWVAK